MIVPASSTSGSGSPQQNGGLRFSMGGGLLCLLSALSSTPRAPSQYLSEGMRAVSRERVANCGLNVACLAVMLVEGTPAARGTVDSMAMSLGCGADWSRPVSLESIGQSLAERGLRVQAFHHPGQAWVRHTLLEHDQAVVVLHLHKPTSHYVVAMRARSGDAIVVADPGSPPLWCADAGSHPEFWARVSPQCLLVRRNTPATACAPADLAQPRLVVVDFGTIDPKQEILVRKIPVTNSSSEPLRLGPLVDSCTCIENVSFDEGSPFLGSGQVRFLCISLNVKKIPRGAVERRITVPLFDASGRESALPIACTIATPPGRRAATAPYVLPALVDLGHHTPVSRSTARGQIHVFVPEGDNISSVAAVQGHYVARAVDIRVADGASGTIHTYEVRPADTSSSSDQLPDRSKDTVRVDLGTGETVKVPVRMTVVQ